MVALADIGAGALGGLGAGQGVGRCPTVNPGVTADAGEPAAGGQVDELDRREVRASAAARRAGEPPARGGAPVAEDDAAGILAGLEAERGVDAADLEVAGRF